jgi:hypothetical protein
MLLQADRRHLQLIADQQTTADIALVILARAALQLEAAIETLRTLVRDNADACSAHHTDGAVHRPRAL